jgi:ferrochelatase
VKTGYLLINLGTPEKPQAPEVRRYLREFLSDPRVLDINPLGRWLLLNFIILPTRPKRSAAAYRKVWTAEGSPLLVHGRALAKGVQAALGPHVPVELAMRYQEPSIGRALTALRDAGVERIVALPLFPQYSSAAYGSAVERLYAEASKLWNVIPIQVLPPFYNHPGFIRAFAEVGRAVLTNTKPDYVLFSFHGLPERHCTKSDDTGKHCLVKADCCAAIVQANRFCYRAQCFDTARRLAETLGLHSEDWEVTFQSRLGRDPWIKPYTDVRVRELAESGKKRLVVWSPAFVADCLETLEEIAMGALESFREHGGEALELVPSLNAEPLWVQTVAQMFREAG